MTGKTTEKVFVVQLANEQTWSLDTSALAAGNAKWIGISTLRAHLYGAPGHTKKALAVDSVQGGTRGLDGSGVTVMRHQRWSGIAAFRIRFFGAPCDVKEVLAVLLAKRQALGSGSTAAAAGKQKW